MTASPQAARPEISVALIVPGDGAGLDRALAALRGQRQPPAMEILVPHHDPALLARAGRHDDVRTVEARGASFDEHRAAAIAAARAPLVALTEDHAVVADDWARRLLEEHRREVAAVGGAIDNAIDRPLAWAVYFCDFAPYMPPFAEGPAARLSDVNVCYKREALEDVREVWERRFHETAVNGALLRRGATLWAAPGVIVRQARGELRLAGALRERYLWGRSYAGAIAAGMTSFRRGAYALLSPLLPAVLLLRRARDVFSKGRNRRKFLRSLPVMTLLLGLWAAGECVGYLTGRPPDR